jgi:hypothetical protein
VSQQKNVRHRPEPKQNRPPVCSQKVTLVADYGTTIAAYYAAVQELEQGMITGSAEVYAKQRQATEEARTLCEAARRALDEHEAEHGC